MHNTVRLILLQIALFGFMSLAPEQEITEAKAMSILHGSNNKESATAEQPEVVSEILQDDGTFPNHEALPLLIYRDAVDVSGGDPAVAVEQVFHSNNWRNSWRNGIYSFHHYHSTTHEVLGIYSGSVKVQMGGPEGVTLEVSAGDVIIIPAGVSHKNLGSSGDFRCVGAYPDGRSWDMNYGKAGERPAADENIASVPIPMNDPVFGTEGPLFDEWE